MLREMYLDDRPKYILVHFHTMAQLYIYHKSLRDHNFNFVVFSNSISQNDFNKTELFLQGNVFFSNDMEQIKSKIFAFGCFLTTNSLPAKENKYALELIYLCKQCGIPVVELQHGLFSYGSAYHMQAKDKMIYIDSLPCESVCDYQATFYPFEHRIEKNICIGYPLYGTKKKCYNGEYVLVLSNMHWMNYSKEEKYDFYHSIFKLANKFQDTLFIWRCHPGELKSKYTKNVLDKLRDVYFDTNDNIIFQNENKILSLINLNDIIAKSKKVITTLSTVLLDCELHEKDTIVYNCESSNSFVSKLKEKRTFSTYSELIDAYEQDGTKLITGYLHPFDEEGFYEFLNKVYKRPTDNYKVLEGMFSLPK